MYSFNKKPPRKSLALWVRRDGSIPRKGKASQPDLQWLQHQEFNGAPAGSLRCSLTAKPSVLWLDGTLLMA